MLIDNWRVYKYTAEFVIIINSFKVLISEKNLCLYIIENFAIFDRITTTFFISEFFTNHFVIIYQRRQSARYNTIKSFLPVLLFSQFFFFPSIAIIKIILSSIQAHIHCPSFSSLIKNISRTTIMKNCIFFFFFASYQICSM